MFQPPLNDITRFAIVFPGRCGSNLLVRMLWKNPAIDLDAYEALAEEEMARGSRRAIRPDEDGGQFLHAEVYGKHKPNATAVGFKFGYRHAASPPHASAWDYLANESVKVIHLTRPNALDYAISLSMATEQGKWCSEDKGGPYERQPVEISFGMLSECVDFIDGEGTRVRELIPAARRLEVVFDDLAAAPVPTAKRVCNFLGVRPRRVKVRTRRQRMFSQREAVANYDQLREAVSAHQPSWLERFFDRA